jgi:hypothetical protein
MINIIYSGFIDSNGKFFNSTKPANSGMGYHNVIKHFIIIWLTININYYIYY